MPRTEMADQFEGTASAFGSIRMLLKWKASLYRVVYVQVIAFCITYAIISCLYRFAMTEEQKRIFEGACQLANSQLDTSELLTFILGFYVDVCFFRRWEQLQAIPWPQTVCNYINLAAPGNDPKSKHFRKSCVRMLLSAFILRLGRMAPAARQFFETDDFDAIVRETEIQHLVRHHDEKYAANHWVFRQMIFVLVDEAARQEIIKDDNAKWKLFEVVDAYFEQLTRLFQYDQEPIPLIYTQVVTISVGLYLVMLILARQYLDPAQKLENYEVDLYVPFFAIFQFIFVFGWLKTGEAMKNPWGGDDEDFDTDWYIRRSATVSLLMVERHYDECRNFDIVRALSDDKLLADLSVFNRGMDKAFLPTLSPTITVDDADSVDFFGSCGSGLDKNSLVTNASFKVADGPAQTAVVDETDSATGIRSNLPQASVTPATRGQMPNLRLLRLMQRRR